MHQNSPFEFKNRKIFPLPRPLRKWGGGHPLPTPYLIRAFGASILAPTELVPQSPTEIAATAVDRSDV